MILSLIISTLFAGVLGEANIHGISLEEFRGLVQGQPFVSSCQYSIVKAHRRYEHAKYQCHTRLDPDGRVAAIANAEQNAEIHNLFIATYGHGIDKNYRRRNPYSFLWIGLVKVDGNWVWDAHPDVPVNYTNWKEGHPKEGDFVRMDRNGFWETTGTHRVHPIVCERSVKYVVFRKGMDYDGAQSMCYNMSMELATVNSSRLPEDLLYTVDRSLSAALDDDDEDSKVWIKGDFSFCNKSEALYGNETVAIDRETRELMVEDENAERSFACMCSSPQDDSFVIGFASESKDSEEESPSEDTVVDGKRRFYGFAEGLSRFEAVLKCKSRGLELAKIESKEENDRAVQVMNKAHGDKFEENVYNSINWFWIGASDDKIEGEFLWDDGTPVEYTNWADGQPDNAHPNKGGQSKVSVFRSNGQWDDSHADVMRSYLCYDPEVSFEQELENVDLEDDSEDEIEEPDKMVSMEQGTETIDEDVDVFVSQDAPSRTDCTSWEYRGQFSIQKSLKSFDEARAACESEGLTLAKIRDEQSNDFMRTSTVVAVPVTAFITAASSELANFWVGLEVDEEDKMSWNGQDIVTYENFQTHHNRFNYSVADGKDAVSVRKDNGQWQWTDRNSRFMFVCEDPSSWVCTETRELEDDEEPCAGMYELKPVYTYSMEYTSYEDAVEVCRAIDQELALPKSEEENEALRSFAEGHHPLTMQVKRNPLNADNWIWIDANDIENEGTFVTYDNETIEWYNWGRRQPDNKSFGKRSSGQDRVAMNKNTGKWFDRSARLDLRAVCATEGLVCSPYEYDENEVTEGPSEEYAPTLYFVTSTPNMKANIGSRVVFSVQYEPVTADLKWTIDNVEVTATEGRVHVDSNGNLVIEEVEDEDQGLVAAVITADGASQFAQGSLEIVENKLLSLVTGDNLGSYEQAKAVCEELGGNIVCPESETENADIVALLGDGITENKSVWIGIQKSESGYSLQDGSEASYLNFADGQPADGVSSFVLNADPEGESYGKWEGAAADGEYGTVCEKVPTNESNRLRF